MYKTLCTPRELADALKAKNGGALIDVRTLEEFQNTHIEGSRCIPISQLAFRCSELDYNTPIMLICKSGKRSQMAYEQLSKLGFSKMNIVEGGIEAWEKTGLPVVKGKAKVSLERQVRIIAGAIVVAGLLIKPLWWLSWFVSIMLVFAGITNTCMMMRLLMLLPYNRNLVAENTSQNISCCG